jgi:hypothetical protein
MMILPVGPCGPLVAGVGGVIGGSMARRVVRTVARVAAEAGRRQSRAMGRHRFPGPFQQLGAAMASWRRKSPKGSENEGIFGGRCACCCRAACRASPVAWRMVRRRRQPVRCSPALQVSAKSARVGSLGDVRHGLSENVVRSIRAQCEAEERKPAEDDYRMALPGPLLLIYLLQGREGGKGSPLYKDGLILPALGLHFPGNLETATQAERPIRYRLNRVAQQQLFEFDDEPADDDDDD